ncbi:aspartic proteinase CDR1-like [Tripterygium wilfordii]|uniref:aspartic proteinase CDR1-like n=1 Tax=Tripterygium wilfordii TaxID=458696 RepID=UPI0018F81F57|nr:aspartic proteinase CDR1-like [Tripterygium wilfordii]
MHNSIIFILLLFSFDLLIQSSAKDKSNRFSFDLFHRDSKISPLYNRSITPSKLLEKAVLDSRTRVNLFKDFTHNNRKDFISEVTPNEAGSYLMKLSLGSPKVEVLASISTGSDLVWVQCETCEKCFGKEEPRYKPTSSSTYNKISFYAAYCGALEHRHIGEGGVCDYSYLYQDGTHTSGVLSTDNFHMKSTVDEEELTIPVVFGCSNLINGQYARGVQGMIGLGSGELSLIFQLKSHIQNRFSYCLLPSTAETSSKLVLGHEAMISGDEVVSTSLRLDKLSTLYFVSLDGVTVENKERKSPPSPVDIVIDSGTTMTFLHSSIYDDLVEHVKDVIDINPVDSPPGRIFNLCYKQQSTEINFPDITFHFGGGADVRLKPENIFEEYRDMHCLMIDRNDQLSIFGNVAQVNFQVEFDYEEMKVSFARADCANQS